MNANEVIQRLDGADLFLRNRANAAPAPLNEYDTCLMLDAAEACNEAAVLIDRQKAENERLKAENKSIRYCYEQIKSYNDTLAESCEKNCKRFNMTTRAEAIKEFAKRLKEKCYEDFQETYEMLSPYVTDDDIDDLVKEMTEEEK